MITKEKLVQYLKNSEAKNLQGLAKLKTIYRPYICPFDEILNLMPDNVKLFDIGCGSGSFLSIINNFKNSDTLAGIEISEKLVQEARTILSSKIKNLTIFKYDGKNIPDEIHNYEYISMIDVFHHIPKNIQKEFLIQLYSKMSSGSYLLFKDIDASSLFVYFNKLHDLVLSNEIGNEISTNNAIKILNNIGFEMIYCSEKLMLLYPHYTILVRKP